MISTISTNLQLIKGNFICFFLSSPLRSHVFKINSKSNVDLFNVSGFHRQDNNMMCFQFPYCGDKEEPAEVSTVHSLKSGSNDYNTSGSEKLRKSKYYPSFSRMPSNLKEFKFTELKSATKNFNLSVKLGEGGFGSVYIGTIKDPIKNQDIKVAVKQLGKRGFQVTFIYKS